MNQAIDRLHNFISTERSRFSNRHDNMFAFSFSQVARYYEFIRLIFKRYEEANKEFIANSRKLQETFSPGNHPLNQYQQKLLNEGRKLTLILHLEIESFYLFAKILLDKISRTIEFYFGRVEGKSLDSHNKLAKNLKDYSSTKGLITNKEFLKSIDSLKKGISNYRDKEITHEKSPRTVKATVYNAQEQSRIASTRIYPTERDLQVESKTLGELLEKIDNYLMLAVDFIESNRERTNLDLKNKK